MSASSKYEKIEKAYKFICDNKKFTKQELQKASGWTLNTTEKN